MQLTDIEPWTHGHRFTADRIRSERRTLVVVAITCVMMTAEILAGWFFNSMALLSDGWHMGTHAAAIGISLFAYRYARKHADDRRFSFGTWKVEIAGAFASAVSLAIIGLYVAGMSVGRLFEPADIRYDQALVVAVIGLSVNVICAYILDVSGGHDHVRGMEHDAHESGTHHHDDINLKSAYLHVVADAATSLLAIIALVCAKFYGWNRLDPAMGILGSILILRWAFILFSDTLPVLLDVSPDGDIEKKVRDAVESGGGAKVSDLHVWRVGQNAFACVVSIVSMDGVTGERYKEKLTGIPRLEHITVEVIRHG